MADGSRHQPYTVPYTGTGAVLHPGGFVPASASEAAPVANPPAPQDATKANNPPGNMVGTRPLSPDAPKPPDVFRYHRAIASADRNDALHRATQPHCISTFPAAEIDARVRSRFHWPS